MSISIILVDDHELFRQGLFLLLESQPDFQVVGQAANGADAISVAEQIQPDIIILDMLMPGLNGLDTLKQLKKLVPKSQIVILSMSDEEYYIYKAIHEGALAYVLKETGADDLVQAVRSVLANKIYLSPRLAERAIKSYFQNPFPLNMGNRSLTNREHQVLRLSVDGLSAVEISVKLSISPRTVETHRANLMHKLGLHTQGDLINYAHLHNLI